MSAGIYGMLAPYYDLFNGELDYAAWADAVEAALARAGLQRGCAVLDLGCGSGRMTVELARRGYDMIGVDAAPEMLAVAREAAERAGVGERCLFLMQDITSFELYGTVEAVVCCLDTLNHLTDYKSLRAALSLVHNYLVPGGVFLFDVNSRRRFEEVYADNVYTFEGDGAFCIWQNEYNKRTHLADFYVTLFTEGADGRYTRSDELTRERMYPEDRLLRELCAAGFDGITVGDTPYGSEKSDGAERLYITARAVKPMPEANDQVQ